MSVRVAVVALIAMACLALPATAGAHAQLERTAPERGAALQQQPQRVVLTFDEPVESSFGALRVYDAGGRRVDTGETERPSGDSVAVELEDRLPDGPYTVTYRVLSVDSHPVSGGFTFTVGEAGGTPAASVADLVDDRGSGASTSVAFAIARALGYAATAVLVGGLAFLLVVWPGGAPPAASSALDRRVRRLLVASALVGCLATALGIVLQGATAAGISFWDALDLDLLIDVLATRFGSVWALRLTAFALVGAVVAAVGWRWGIALALPAAFLVLAPALSGHARADDDAWLLVPLDVLHVAAMSVWVGGVALLTFAVPAGTRRLEPPQRTRLLASVVARFSTVALICVGVLLATGIAQAVAQLATFDDLLDTAFGRTILVKAGLLALLIALGAHNRRRSQPRLRRLADDGGPPGPTGLALRRALRAEVATMAIVLVASAALVSYSPSASGSSGPYSASRDSGAARVELTVSPARAGRNEIHLYLFDRSTGAQLDRVRDLEIAAVQRQRAIGPIALDVRRTGPGHYTALAAQLAPGGTWELVVRGRVSTFEELRADFEVPVR